MPFNGPAGNIAAIQAAWTTAKSHLSSFNTDLANLIADLANLESDRDIMEGFGAGDISEWLRVQIAQARVGFQPRVATGNVALNGPGFGRALPAQVLLVQAPNPSIARDTTTVDTRAIGTTPTGQLCQLS